MKRIMIVVLLLVGMLSIVGCNITTTETETETETTETELQRFKVKVVEIVTGDDDYDIGYVVEKDGYVVGGIYRLKTENVYQLGDIVYVVILDNYTCMPFVEWLEETDK